MAADPAQEEKVRLFASATSSDETGWRSFFGVLLSHRFLIFAATLCKSKLTHYVLICIALSTLPLFWISLYYFASLARPIGNIARLSHLQLLGINYS